MVKNRITELLNSLSIAQRRELVVLVQTTFFGIKKQQQKLDFIINFAPANTHAMIT